MKQNHHTQRVHVPRGAPAALRRALVVDPDPDTRALYRLYLASAYSVTEATDGRDALAQVYNELPHVIIADAQLPFIDGGELCRLLRSDSTFATVPLIIVSANPLAETVERLRQSGASAVLIKPLTQADLLEQVRHVDPTSAADMAGAVVPNRSERDSAVALPPGDGTSPTGTGRRRGRVITRQPAVTPPQLRCPACDRQLQYDRSHMGGVGARQEQWDYYVCAACGTFQYRHRTRKLRRLS